MARDKKFGKSLFGYNSSEVDLYIQKIVADYEDELSEKEDEMAQMQKKLREITIQFDEISKTKMELENERDRIAKVFVKAQEKADLIIEDAHDEASREKKEVEILVESEREKLVSLREELQSFKQNTYQVLKKFEQELDDAIYDDKDKLEEEVTVLVKDDVLEEAKEPEVDDEELISIENQLLGAEQIEEDEIISDDSVEFDFDQIDDDFDLDDDFEAI